jgi:CPA2 family monovalent cation:H+ antiporter-2
MDPALPRLVAALWVVVGLAMAGRRLGQPMPVVYMLAGIVLGPFGLAVLEDTVTLARIGEFGVILLLFLLGAEIRLERLLASWRTPVLGIVLQVVASVATIGVLGTYAGWPMGRTVLIGFAISLSSTAVVLRLLESRKLQATPLGGDILAILLAQDLALAPMVVAIGLLGGGHPSALDLLAQAAGTAVLMGSVAWVAWRGRWELPFADALRADSELKVFAGLLFALTVALFAALCGLSAAFGAFVAGVLVGATQDSEWVEHSLHPLRVVLVAVFLAAVGTLIDVDFLQQNAPMVAGLAALALATNTVINGVILKLLGRPWPEAWLGGALLSQIGEFSFVLAAIGLEVHMISEQGYQLALSVIATTLLFSAVWITVVERAVGKAASAA